MKEITIRTFEKRIREGRLEVFSEIRENKEEIIVEIKKGSGTEYLRIIK